MSPTQVLFTLLTNQSNRTKAVGILGVKSRFPCPICLVPNSETWDLSRVWDPRSQVATIELMKTAGQQTTKKATSEKLLEQSIRIIQVSYPLLYGGTLLISTRMHSLFVLDSSLVSSKRSVPTPFTKLNRGHSASICGLG